MADPQPAVSVIPGTPRPRWHEQARDLAIRIGTAGYRFVRQHPDITVLGALLALPAVTGLVAAVSGLDAIGELAGEGGAQRRASAGLHLGWLIAIYAMGLGVLWLRLMLVHQRQTETIGRMERLLRRQSMDLRDSRDHNELLTAMRDVSRVVGGGQDHDTILGDVLSIFSTLAEPCHVALLVDNGSGLERHPCSDDPAWDADAAALAAETADRRQVFRRLEPIEGPRHIKPGRDRAAGNTAQLELFLPFEADADQTGVLYVRRTVATDPIPVADTGSGMPATTAPLPSEAEAFERRARHFIKHVALAVRHVSLYDRATVDGLTRLWNREHWNRQLDISIAMASRQQAPLSVILIDIDHFKAVNDTHGHLTGDLVLRGVADIIQRTIRDADMAFRYGGEEMTVLCPGTTAAEAAVTAERIRSAIQAADLRGEENTPVPVTASFGVSCLAPSEQADPLVARADAALYESKHNGRNQVTLAAEPGAAKAA